MPGVMNSKPHIQDLIGQDLSGFKLAIGFTARLKRGHVGYFPLVYNRLRRTVRQDISSYQDIVVTLEKSTIAKVANLLEYRPHEIERVVVLVNESQELGFFIEGVNISTVIRYSDALPACISGQLFHLLTEDRLTVLARQSEEPFKWAYGLL